MTLMFVTRRIALLLGALVAVPTARAQQVVPSRSPTLRYIVCPRAEPPPLIDGRLDVQYSGYIPYEIQGFVDIEGRSKPPPALDVVVYMLWDDDYLYILARLGEPHVWATLTDRDAVIYHDNDFEVFIDPDGDTHDYYELEVNALGTVFDLLLKKPYRDGGPALHEWDIEGLKVATRVEGTINDPSDLDTAWVVELALPWEALREYAPEGRPPRGGEQWRVNFSRVQWDVEVVDGEYRKVTDPQTGEPLPEHNWVWTPQHAVNMHMPEMWGIVQFSDQLPPGTHSVLPGVRIIAPNVPFRPPLDEDVRWALRLVYYAQRAYMEQHGRYGETLEELSVNTQWFARRNLQPVLGTTADGYVLSLPRETGTWYIRQDGKIWRE
jgi:hypothetical protein